MTRFLDWGRRTYVFGVLNVSPDSFSGDGVADTPRALERARTLRDDGADVIDVGGESTRPGHAPISAAEELRRVEPVLAGLAAGGLVVSIDTRKAAVARRALELGARIVNDVSGLADPQMARVIAGGDALAILMHDRDVRGADDPVAAVRSGLAALLERAERGGIARERTVLDPGFGFGKGPRENLALLRGLARLRDLGRPLLVGTSRKGTIGLVLGGLPPEDRVAGTAATVALAVANGADAVRVHDVREMARVARMADAVVRGPHRAYIGLGGNLGDRAAALRAALAQLGAIGRILAASSLYETTPWGKSDQPDFLNAACILETDLDPHALLRELQGIERRLGRAREHEERWGPRAIDLDLLLYDDLTLRARDLELPHPGLGERAFALAPLAEIAPDARHPASGLSIRELAERAGTSGVRRLGAALAPAAE